MTFFRLWRVDYTSEENVLTEQMWFLPLISYWEVMTRIFCGYCCFWSAWFALRCKSISLDLFWNAVSSSLPLNKGFRLFNFLQSASWIRIIISDCLLVHEYDGFLRCLSRGNYRLPSFAFLITRFRFLVTVFSKGATNEYT